MSTMINYTYLLDTNIIALNEHNYQNWIKAVISSEGKKPGDIRYVFCNDDYLLNINKKYLKHDTLTDVITFSTSNNRDIISGEIFISITRIIENSNIQLVSFNNELSRVMVHGILHLVGYNDHTIAEKKIMRSKEDYYIHLQLNKFS
jgi:rRNA maturation RNase YbeY